MSDKNVLQIGTLMIVVSVLLRLTLSLWTPALQASASLDFGQVFLFLQTGKVLYAPTATVPTAAVPTASAPTAAAPETTQPPPEVNHKAVFSESDQALVELRNTSGKTPNVSAALLQTLQWDLYSQQPTVLILHSHGSESYTNTEAYTETTRYRTLETDYNMISIGDLLAQELEKAGIRVIHDRTMYDVPSYNDAYVQARSAIADHLKKNPSICLVLDLHRDAATDSSGNQISYSVSTPEGTAAQLMLVLGTNHDHWQENLSLATKLQVQLEKQVPGLCRPINVRSQRFNQDLCPGAVLVEVGAAGNSRQEALLAAKYLAKAVISLAAGTS